MKFLDVARLNAVTSYLDNCTVGDRRLRGRVESYSCKMAGEDKKLHKALQQQYEEQGDEEQGENAPDSTTTSAISTPVGKMSDPATRRLLINLICTMNATFPDYDFSGLGPDQFVRKNLGIVVNSVNTNLSELVAKQSGPNFLEELWGAIDQEIDLKQSQVISYLPDVEDDPFNVPGSLWSFNYFFYNPDERKIVFFTCCCTTSLHGDDFYGVAREDEEEFNDLASETMSNAEETGDLLDAEAYPGMTNELMDVDSDDSEEDAPGFS